MTKQWLVRAAVLAVMGCAVAGTLPAGAQTAVVTLVNDTSWDIHHLYLSPVTDEEWGEDQLGEHILESGGSFDLYKIPCDDYDVMLVDEDGDECIVEDIEICEMDEEWLLDDETLLACEFFGG